MDTDRIAGTAKDVIGKAEAAASEIAGEARTHAAGLAREATGAANDSYGETKHAARQAVDTAASYAKDSYERGGDTLQEGSQALAKKVQQNPLGSIVIASAIGFALALFVMRPPRRRTPRWRYNG